MGERQMGERPFDRTTRFRHGIDLNVAPRHLQVPTSLLARADEVIE
jgi:hypothetical protein